MLLKMIFLICIIAGQQGLCSYSQVKYSSKRNDTLIEPKVGKGIWVCEQDTSFSIKITSKCMVWLFNSVPTDTFYYKVSYKSCDTSYYTGKDRLIYMQLINSDGSTCYELTNNGKKNYLSWISTLNGRVTTFKKRH